MTLLQPLHDELFRKALENPIVAKEFFEAHLPADVKEIMDISTLYHLPEISTAALLVVSPIRIGFAPRALYYIFRVNDIISSELQLC